MTAAFASGTGAAVPSTARITDAVVLRAYKRLAGSRWPESALIDAVCIDLRPGGYDDDFADYVRGVIGMHLAGMAG